MPTAETDKIAREALDAGMTLGEACEASMKLMMEYKNMEQAVTIMHKGSIYYFNIECVGVKPPYVLRDPEADDTAQWFGQRIT